MQNVFQRNLSEARRLFNTEKSNNTRVQARNGFCPPWLQSTHRVEMADFWRSFHHGGKISPGWWGGGDALHALPLSIYLPSFTKLQRTLQLRGQTHSPIFISTLYVICCPDSGSEFSRWQLEIPYRSGYPSRTGQWYKQSLALRLRWQWISPWHWQSVNGFTVFLAGGFKELQ